jgi:histone acetyltransferase
MSESSKKRKAPSESDEQDHATENGGNDVSTSTQQRSQSISGNRAIDELASGQEQQTEPAPPTSEGQPIRPAAAADLPDKNESKNPYDNLRYCIVTNDGKEDSLIKLIGLKQLFSKQLPKMPRAYIARLVFDRRHTSLAILSSDPEHQGTDDEIIGGICYRGFDDMRFAEIAFCAVNASHQVKVCVFLLFA